MAISEKRREEILEEERLRMQVREDFWREHWKRRHCHRGGLGLFWCLALTAAAIAAFHTMACWI